jgi:6-pyruvoyltetrahydropterin/6-carboxytetrahydropterin synthase
MASVVKSFSFDAAHQLPGHKGKCKNLHGHTYRLEVECDAAIKLPNRHATEMRSDDYMAVDFDDISKVIKPAIEAYFDHHFINETMAKDIPRTTAEAIACWFFDLAARADLPVIIVRLWETPNSYVAVTKSDVIDIRGRPQKG